MQSLKHWTEEEYLAFERASETRHEFVNGDVYAMSGASLRHARLLNNLFLSLGPQARRRGCEAYGQGVQVRIRQIRDTRYYYPDLVISCDSEDDDTHTLARPCLIVEVLSPTTALTDHREKKRAYLSLPSLKQYVLVDQDLAHIESLRREGEGWLQELLSQGDRLRLECVEAELDFETIYAGVDVQQPMA
ncbi:MAG: Uma2 family endonuclease [Panacagrimonas sp.]